MGSGRYASHSVSNSLVCCPYLHTNGFWR